MRDAPRTMDSLRRAVVNRQRLFDCSGVGAGVYIVNSRTLYREYNRYSFPNRLAIEEGLPIFCRMTCTSESPR